jgi:hypothetical protein
MSKSYRPFTSFRMTKEPFSNSLTGILRKAGSENGKYN